MENRTHPLHRPFSGCSSEAGILWAMDERAPTDTEALMIEIRRYLAAVEVFRAEQCEPRWRPELAYRDPAVRRIVTYGRTATPSGSG